MARDPFDTSANQGSAKLKPSATGSQKAAASNFKDASLNGTVVLRPKFPDVIEDLEMASSVAVTSKEFEREPFLGRPRQNVTPQNNVVGPRTEI